MSSIRIDTMEQFEAVRASLVPEHINSKTHGRVLVPCCNTILVSTELVVANLYNPNSVSDDKMELLKQSILDNGFCFPVVAIWDGDQQRFVVIDGFHRTTIGGPEWLDFDYVPVVVLDHDITKRMAATVQFNKARGVHQVDLDAEVIRALIEQGLAEDEIAQRLGIDLESVHRYKQITGVAELFRNSEYSMSWEIAEVDDDANPGGK
jgi:ParB-like chromosome segregation protein Spo0J